MRDYQFEESKVVMQELIEDVASRLRAEKKLARTIHFSFGYAEGGGIHTAIYFGGSYKFRKRYIQSH